MNLVADESIPKHKIANRLTSVERRLTERFAQHKVLIACVGNIGTGKSSLVKYLAFNTAMNALFELPDEGFEDYLPGNDAVHNLLTTSKETAKRTLGAYYGSINHFLEIHKSHPIESPQWMSAKKSLEKGALDIQHAYLDLRKMQLQAVTHLKGSSCIDGSPLADRYAFCEVLHRDMEVPFLSSSGLAEIEARLRQDFANLPKPDLMVFLHGPSEALLENIRERQRAEEIEAMVRQAHHVQPELPDGLVRLVKALDHRYNLFMNVVQETKWYRGPVLSIDVSKIDFVSNVRHLIAVFEGIEKLLP